MNGNIKNVFISKSVKDRDFARALYQELKQEAGLSPWLDVEDLRPGQEWELGILTAIHSAHIALVCISSSALPLTGFFKREVHEIIDLTRKRSLDEYQALILLLDQAQIPEELSGYPTVNALNGPAEALIEIRKKLNR